MKAIIFIMKFVSRDNSSQKNKYINFYETVAFVDSKEGNR